MCFCARQCNRDCRADDDLPDPKLLKGPRSSFTSEQCSSGDVALLESWREFGLRAPTARSRYRMLISPISMLHGLSGSNDQVIRNSPDGRELPPAP